MPDNGGKADGFVEKYQERLSQAVPCGGGCTETWNALESVRNQPDDCCGGSPISNRRSFLRKSFSGVTATVALSGIASARNPSYKKDNLHEGAESYQNAAAARKAVQTTGSTLLKELSSRGILDQPSVSALPMRHISSKDEYTNEGEGTVVAAQGYEDSLTARILVGKQLEQGKLIVSVLPQMDVALGIVKNGDSDLLIKPIGYQSGTSSNVNGDEYITTSACMLGQQCMQDDWEEPSCAQYDIYCCDDGSCTIGDLNGPCLSGCECLNACCTVCNTC